MSNHTQSCPDREIIMAQIEHMKNLGSPGQQAVRDQPIMKPFVSTDICEVGRKTVEAFRTLKLK